MKKITDYQAARIFLGVILGLWIFALCLIIANHTLSCVDRYGCLKSTCDITWLNDEYQALVKANEANCG